MAKRRRNKLLRLGFAFFLVMAIGLPGAYYVNRYFFTENLTHIPTGKLQLAEHNYSEELRRVAQEQGLPYEYLMALIVLETSGTKPAGSRFEKHVFRKLQRLQQGERQRFEDLRQEDLQDASEDALRNLATSWGPFQLMGYKCLGLGVNISDIRDEGSLELGARWIKKEYGHLLKKKRYRDAFHYHNAGSVFPPSGIPKTHDPNYVNRGLIYLDYFKVTAEGETK